MEEEQETEEEACCLCCFLDWVMIRWMAQSVGQSVILPTLQAHAGDLLSDAVHWIRGAVEQLAADPQSFARQGT